MKAYVLLSGGIDSSTCLAIALDETDGQCVGVSIDYGQRHRKEIEYAKKQCALYVIQHHVISLKEVVPQTMLTNKEVPIPDISYEEIKGVSPTYVPYRNGLMLSALTSFATGQSGDDEIALYFGAHAEDAQNWAYPDCTPEFIGAMANAIWVGTYRRARLITPLQWLKKHEIIIKGSELKVDWSNTWSCYAGEELHCGVCPTCRARKLGFQRAGILDPTEYASTQKMGVAEQ